MSQQPITNSTDKTKEIITDMRVKIAEHDVYIELLKGVPERVTRVETRISLAMILIPIFSSILVVALEVIFGHIMLGK